jgi:hypothetical protein
VATEPPPGAATHYLRSNAPTRGGAVQRRANARRAGWYFAAEVPPPLAGAVELSTPQNAGALELYENSGVHPAQVRLRRCAVRLAALDSRPGCGRTLRLGPGQRPTVPRCAGRPGGGANPKFVPWAARPEIGRSRRRGGAWLDPIYGASEQAMSW